MAKVEMSLHEYNGIKEELDFLHRVIKELTTIKVDDWNLEYVRNHQAEGTAYSQLSNEVKTYLDSQILQNIPEKYRAEDLGVEPNTESLNIAHLKYVAPPIEVDECELEVFDENPES